jgi:hypothetical protein
MGGTSRKKTSRRAWELAERQHGLLTRQQLLSLGYGRRAIEHRIRRGRLHRVGRGVYAVGRPPNTLRQRWMAAVLACGKEATLSHRSAGHLWGMLASSPARVEVSVRGNRNPCRPGIRGMRRPGLGAIEVTEVDGIPVTTPFRTLLDLATELRPERLERAVNEADKLDLIDPDTLREELGRRVGERGTPALRRLLDRDSFRLSDSELETRFRPIAIRAGLPPPLSKELVNGFEVDFHWPELGLVVETDGLRYHRTPSAQARDRIRDQAHAAAGLVALRFTHRQVTREPAYVAEILRRSLSARRGP